MENTKVVTATAEATIWTDKTGTGEFTVFRGTSRIGMVTKNRRGWEASFGGVITRHATKAQAIESLVRLTELNDRLESFGK